MAYILLYEDLEVNDGRWEIFYVCVYAEVLAYIETYDDVEVYGGREAISCVVCLGACVWDQIKTRLFLIHWIIRSSMKKT